MKKQVNLYLNNPSGITLIGLVITIIILLILVGISISMMLGDNGIVNQAIGAVSETRKATVKEEIALAWTSCYNEYFLDWTVDFNKQKEDYFTTENLQKYLEKKGTVLNVAYNPNGASRVVYESKTDNLVYRVKVDNNIVTVVREPDTDRTIRLADKVTSDNYGDTISNYTVSPNGIAVSDWKIFYNDDTHVFLILSNYLNNNTISNELVNTIGVNRGINDCSVYWAKGDSRIPSFQSDDIDKEKLSLFRAGIKYGYELNPNNENSKCVATLLNTDNWVGFVNSSYADSAIGSPTLEMWLNSWNEKYNDTLVWGTGDRGYTVGEDKNKLQSSIKPMDNRLGFQHAVKMNELGSNIKERNLYYPYTQEIVGIAGYWLASPGNESTANQNLIHIQHVNYNGAFGSYNFSYDKYALRPVIALNAELLGEQSHEYKTWQLVQE